MKANTYTLRASNGTQVTVRGGNGSPKMTGGGGGWETVARPRRVGLTLWRGRDPYAMDVPVNIDGWLEGKSVENDIAKLNQMQMGADLREPPTVQIDGAVPVKGIKWVITIEWGDVVIWERDRSGKPFRLRQDAILHMTQYNPEKRVTIKRDASRTPVTYTVKKGDTLRTIAKKMYGDGDRWKDIARAQTPPLRILGTKQLYPKHKTLRIPGV